MSPKRRPEFDRAVVMGKTELVGRASKGPLAAPQNTIWTWKIPEKAASKFGSRRVTATEQIGVERNHGKDGCKCRINLKESISGDDALAM